MLQSSDQKEVNVPSTIAQQQPTTSETIQPADTPFSPTEQTVQLQYPSSQPIPPTNSNPPEIKPAVATNATPSATGFNAKEPLPVDTRDPNSVHIPHLHLPSMFHKKEDPIHVANEYDKDGYKAEKAFLWSCLGSLCLCLFGCWCIPWIPFVFVQTKYSKSSSNRARRYAELAKVTWLVILVSLIGVFLLGVVIAIVVPSVYSGVKQKI